MNHFLTSLSQDRPAAWLHRVTMAAAVAALLPAWAAAQATAPLNDTGVPCHVACNDANYPGQDGRYGRDAAQARGVLFKTGGGVAAFDFTALDASGTVTTTLGSHKCVYDNVTGLLWSSEINLASNWADAVNAASVHERCGRNAGWRLPTRRELLSIVYRGVLSPAIDGNYFPSAGMGTMNNYYTIDEYAPDASAVWVVDFYGGHTELRPKNLQDHSRFVRSGLD